MKNSLIQKHIPTGWRITSFGEVASLRKGLTYKSSDYSDKENGMVFLTLKSILRGGGFNPDGIKYYLGKYDDTAVLKQGDLIIANTDITRNAEVVGAPVFVPHLSNKPVLMSMDLSAIDVDEKKINKLFFYHLLRDKKARDFMRNQASGSTVLHLKTSNVPKFEFQLPTLSEQEKIASILNTVDENIKKVSEVIFETEKLKTGLVASLFTKGINHKRFQKSKSGSIPEGWTQKKLGEVCNFTTGKLDSNRAVSNGSYPFFTCSKETFRIDQYSFDSEAILLAGNNAAGVYSVKYYNGKFDAYQRTYVITVKNLQDLNYHFLKEIVNAKLNLLKDMSFGTTTKFLTLSLLLNIKVNLPRIEEQRKIADILLSVDKKISINKELRTALIKLKMGLMSDLLSGKVRTK